jgi:hypothetical protein
MVRAHGGDDGPHHFDSDRLLPALGLYRCPDPLPGEDKIGALVVAPGRVGLISQALEQHLQKGLELLTAHAVDLVRSAANFCRCRRSCQPVILIIRIAG